MTKGVPLKRILFVDDEQHILDSMRRCLFDMMGIWELEFASSGEDALKIMEKSPVSVIVSDMRMPNMDGAALLQKVQELYPDTIRFILSGFSDREMILRTVGPADQFMAKPCDPKYLKSVITNALASQEMMQTGDLKTIAANMKSLPTLPDLYVKIQQVLESDKSSFKDIAEMVQQDLTVTAKVLQLVNSAFFGLRSRIDNVQRAVTYIGIETLKAIVLTTDVFSQFSDEEVALFHIDELYQHSTFVSLLARKIVETVSGGKELADTAGMAGMLHDIGKLILIRNKSEEYKQIMARAGEEKKPLYVLEKEVLGLTHAEMGAYLMGIWGLPEQIVKAILVHHTAREAFDVKFDPPSAVFVANYLAHEENADSQYSLGQELEKGHLTKFDIMKHLPEWRKVTKLVKSMQGEST